MTAVPTARERVVRRLPAAGLTLTFVLLAFVPLTLQTYQIGEWTFAMAFAIAAVGLNTMIADGGLVSLGHNAFFAFGAYTTAWLASHNVSYWQCLFVVAGMSLVLGWLIGPPIVRLGHLNFALLTVGIGFVAPTIAIRLDSVTGGANGEALPAFVAPGWTGLTSVAWLYYMGLLVLLVCLLAIIGLRRSQAGRALRAQRDNSPAAEAFGVQVGRLRCGVFALSVMMAGIGGWLWGIAAGIFAQFLPSLSSNISPAFGGLVQGAIIVVVLLVARRGVLGTVRQFIVGLGDRVSHGSGDDAAASRGGPAEDASDNPASEPSARMPRPVQRLAGRAAGDRHSNDFDRL
jgi:branched-chain amino acid transport system permease protein